MIGVAFYYILTYDPRNNLIIITPLFLLEHKAEISKQSAFKNVMHRSGFEPELLAWKAKVIAARPSVLAGC